jgi:RNA polymerase sigma factor for flagellar operon FliA
MAANTSSLTPADRLREEALVTEHMPLVRHLVTDTVRRLPAHVSRDELLSAGMIALAQAARAYDDSRGVPFGRFAATRVRGALIDELRSSDWASRSVRRRARERDAAEEALTAKLGRTPKPAEIADELGLSIDEVGAVEEDVQRALVLSLQGFSESFGVEDHVESHEPAPEDVIVHRERVGYLHDAVAVLPERLRTVVQLYFFEERPMTEIAEQLGVSESRVSQMRAEALAMLKDGLNAQLDPELVTMPARPEGCAARRRGAYYAAVAARGTLHSRLAAGAEAVVA